METLLTRDGLRVAYYIDDFTDPWTRPDTMLLLHSAMGNSRRWWQWVPRLVRKYRVVRMDLRGHGASQIPDPEKEFSLAQMVGDVVDLLDHLECKDAHLVGNSAGGYVAQQLAIHHPSRVKTLSLFGSTPGLKHSYVYNATIRVPRIQQIGLKAFLEESIHENFDEKADPLLVKWFIEQASSNDPAFIARFVMHMCTHDFMDQVSRIRCPTLIVAPGKESLNHRPPDTYEKMRERITGSQLIYYDTTGHNVTNGYPHQCVDDLLNFLSRHGY